MKLKTAVQLSAHCEVHRDDDPMWMPVYIEWDWDGVDGSGLVIVQTGNPYCDRCQPQEKKLSIDAELEFLGNLDLW